MYYQGYLSNSKWLIMPGNDHRQLFANLTGKMAEPATVMTYDELNAWNSFNHEFQERI
jgi:hypothetical protein